MDISKLSYEKKIQLAKNPNTPVEVLAALAKDEDYYVRYGVARNPNSPVGVLAELAKDEYSYIRYWVADNPNSPIEALAVLLSVELQGNWDKYTLKAIFNHLNSTDTIRAIIKTVFPGVQ